MTEKERQDLAVMNREVDRLHQSFFSIARDAERATEHDKQVQGMPGWSVEKMVFHYYQYYRNQIDVLIKSHLQKYPD